MMLVNKNEIERDYETRYPILQKAAREILLDLREILPEGTPHIDIISARAKATDRFVEKALKLDEKGNRKYQNPLNDIQDQIGVRVVVFYLSDVEVIAKRINENYRPIEDVIKREDIPEKFSYRARHFICRIPPEIRATTQPPIGVFELQISTLFQHAWAEAEHDTNYKSKFGLDDDAKRRIALAAAQAWGADIIFDEIFKKQQEPSKN